MDAQPDVDLGRLEPGTPESSTPPAHYFMPSVRFWNRGTGIMLALMAVGALIAIYRFTLGLGATTNLSDQYPWGIWVAFDVVCGVALAAGGFTTAAVVYVFWGEKYHGLVRPAVLTGFLGYLFVAVGLLVDLGQPWHIWHPIIFWPKHSALFEVAWCVMLYMSVLALEFLPSVFERFHWTVLQGLYDKLVPWFVVAALAWFTYIMSHSIIWAGAAFVVLAMLALFLPVFVQGRKGVPILLIIAGVLFSTAHQSSLGTLFLLTPDKLNHLWWTPMLPVNFFLSAVAVGFAMVIFESTLSSRAFAYPVENAALEGFARILKYVLIVYLLVRVGDIAARGQLPLLATGYGLLFLAEISLGVLAPIVILSIRSFRGHIWIRFTAACLMIFGLIFNRFNVTLLAMDRPGADWYFPSPEEILITVSLVAAIMFFYTMFAKLFPVLPQVPGDETGGITAGAKR
jgi:formate dehydrogenase iron-sulfur subunit